MRAFGKRRFKVNVILRPSRMNRFFALDEQIYTIDQLCNISDDSWTHLEKISEVVKRLIIIYKQTARETIRELFNFNPNSVDYNVKSKFMNDAEEIIGQPLNHRFPFQMIMGRTSAQRKVSLER